LPSIYTRFFDKVSVVPEHVLGDVQNLCMFKFESNNGQTGIPLYSLEQRRSWIFTIFKGPGRGYNVELFSFQMANVSKTGPFPTHEQRWGVRIYHPQWDTLFAENQYLDVGMRANWEPAEWQFFPPEAEDIQDAVNVEGMEFETGTGYQKMLDAVAVVEKIIKGEPLPVQPFMKKNTNGSQKHTRNKTMGGSGKAFNMTKATPKPAKCAPQGYIGKGKVPEFYKDGKGLKPTQEAATPAVLEPESEPLKQPEFKGAAKDLDSLDFGSTPLENKPLEERPLEKKPIEERPLEEKPLDRIELTGAAKDLEGLEFF
jgi:hypothetical protein